MPTYDFKCEKCGNQFECFKSINDIAEVTCSTCGHLATKMIGTGSGIIFKGSGFYITDYKKKNTVS